MSTPIHQIPAEEVRAELDAVLNSNAFARASSLARLLDYLCEKHLRGEGDQIKEYTIAVEAYGRHADFQQKENSIVRVEIKRLRDKLRQFYETEGALHKFQIMIPVGQYAPVFVEKEPAAEEAPPLPLKPELATPEFGAEEPREVQSQPDESRLAETPAPTLLRSSGKRSRWVWVGVGALIFTGALAFALKSREPANVGVVAMALHPNGGDGKSVSATATAPAPGAEADEIRILAGSQVAKFIDRAGRIWTGERFFNGGALLRTPQASWIYRTMDPEIYRTGRLGDFSYDIPLKPGTYELRLHFAENFYGPETLHSGGETSRLFTVTANDKPLLSLIDVYSEANGSFTAEIKVFKDITPAADGLLHLKFSSCHDKAILNGLELLPSRPGTIRPVRLTALDNSVITGDGQVWQPDQYFKGGRMQLRMGNLSGSSTPELYQAERFGHFTYAIPVAPGHYTVILHFAERYFGPTNVIPRGKGPGSRVFNVFCNGLALLKNFDIFQAAGGQDRAIVKKFTGLTPNPQGKLLLEFQPVVNYALINAIEVIDENH